MKSIKVYKDISLNILSSIIFTATLQILIYPFLSHILPETKFGTVLTVIGISNSAAAIFGGSLNNIRLLEHKTYEKNNEGDFSFLLLFSLVSSVLFSYLGFIFFQSQLEFYEILLLCIVSFLTTLRSYGTVYYRVSLNFINVLKHMMFTSIGYVTGLTMSVLFQNWIFSFLVGELFSLLYLIITTSLFREKFIITKRFKITRNKYVQLALSNVSGNLLLYLDRLLINPILGASQVAVYYAASIVGKMAGIILQPLTGVFLSYLSQSKENSGWSYFKRTFFLSIIFGLLLYMLSLLFSPIIIEILYEDLFMEALKIYRLANLGAIIQVCSTLLQPILFKYCKLWWQNVIQLVYAVFYISLGLVFMNHYGLEGFIYAVIISNLIKYLLIVFIAIVSLKPKTTILKSKF